MKNCHDDRLLNSMIGKKVRIVFKDGTEEVGVLAVPGFGNGYLIKTVSRDYRFYKSHMKRIEVLCE